MTRRVTWKSAVAAIIAGTSPALAAAPSVPLFGSFFPFWLLSLFVGVVLTVLLRLVFVLIGLDDILRWRVPVYMSMALGITYLVSLLVFGR
ncbi:hypothetical protein KW403_07415 [Nitratireductor kimnyeongensis]|nr:hypothetical protein KW403_07415 [Nitratireductor kimnyeongensis]